MLTGTRRKVLNVLMMFAALGTFSAFADAKKIVNPLTIESKHRIIITHPVVIKEGGSLEEVMSLARLWKTNVVDPIPEVLKTEFLLEEKSKKEYELLMVYYFKNREGEMTAMGKMGPLIQKAWPDEKKRNQFFVDLASYIDEKKKTTNFYSVVE